MSEKHKIARAAGTIGMGTLLSRIFGFLRDMVTAHFFGAGMAADAFFVAFRIPNLWRRLVGEGSLTISFIPVYIEYIAQRPEEETRKLTHIAFTIAGVILLLVTLGGIVLSPFLMRIIAPGWYLHNPEKFHLSVTLNRVIFPYLFFIGLFALSMGVLNSRRHFFAPAFAPIFLNICMILSVFLFYGVFSVPVFALALGVVAGGVIQLLFQVPFLLKKGVTFRFNFDLRHPAIKRIGLLMVPGVIGTAVYQLNVFVDTIFASFLPQGSVSYLYFADRLLEFPLGIFAMAVGMAALPSLSELASRGRIEELKEAVSFAVRLVSFISIPAMVGLISLKTPIINLLFQRGVFDYSATMMTARALLCYSVGLWAIAGARTLIPAYYALQDTWTPLKVALICLATNVVLNTILMIPFEHAGLALATSFSSMLNVVLLSRKLSLKLGGMGMREIGQSMVRMFISSLPMGLIGYFVCSFGDWTTTGDSLEKLALLLAAIGLGLSSYLGVSYWMKNEEMISLLKMVGRRRRRRAPI